jgi:hypothetical protein
MRLIRQSAVAVGLAVLLFSSAAMGMGALLAATGGPAQAAVVNPSGGGATGSVDPSSATPGSSVTFQVFCASLDTSSATLFGTTLGLPEQIPMDKESGNDGTFSATVTLPSSIQPGTYTPDMDCSDGSSATATLKVTALPSPGVGVQTGDGTTSTRTNTGLAEIGVALVAVGAVAGAIALRRKNATRQ